MGRAGSGSGGGRASSGGHSAGRMGGGHSMGRMGGGGRAGSGNFGRGFAGSFGSGPRTSGRGPGMPPPPPGRGPGMYPPPGVGPGMYPPPPRRYRRRPHYSGGGCLASVVVWIMILIFVIIMFQSCAMSTGGSAGYTSSSSSGSQRSTIVREKLNTGNAYINDCVKDELGWFDSVSKTESQLKDFWEKTGVQPYIILRDYDAGLSTNSAKEQWALDYYDENFDTENIFLFVYFAEADTDNDVGYMAYANGYQTSSVMDSEAVEIFWNNIDKYWYTNLSTDEVFVNAFHDTANTIMHVSTTGKDLLKWGLIVTAIVLVGAIVINLVKQKNKRAREKAEEDQRILNTPIHDMAEDHLEDKYL